MIFLKFNSKFAFILFMNKELNLDAIFRYTFDCQFSNEDWQKVLDQCRTWFGGGKIHRSLKPRAQSTYKKFMDWVNTGFKYGDYVSYGNICGIVGTNVPTGTTVSENDIDAHSGVFLSAYLDLDGNLIAREMEVRNPERLKPLDDERKHEFRKKLHDAGLEYCIRSNSVGELYIPQKNFYVSLENGFSSTPAIGMYLESDGCKHHFAALLSGRKLEMDCWVDSNYTPLKPASESEIRLLHNATSKAGWAFNEREKRFAKQKVRNGNNVYYYLNETFDLVMDKDNGAKKHADRFDAGNYFTDRTEAFAFLIEIKKMRGKA